MVGVRTNPKIKILTCGGEIACCTKSPVTVLFANSKKSSSLTSDEHSHSLETEDDLNAEEDEHKGSQDGVCWEENGLDVGEIDDKGHLWEDGDENIRRELRYALLEIARHAIEDPNRLEAYPYNDDGN
jgi:hypothetical protein